jgi:4-amino-4-deoxy-L-arabinose transferase-like glycosyltransferase
MSSELNNTASRRARQLYWLALIALVLAGFGLRVFRADHQEIWGDEAAKLEVVNQGLAHLFSPGAEVHPRFFHAWLFLWHRLFGYNVFGLRMLPVLFGVLGLPLIAALARRMLRSRGGAAAAAFVLAFSPFHLAYSQDLTMYSLLFAMLALSFCSLWRVLEESQAGWSRWGLYVVLTILTFHTHYYSVFALIAQNAYVLIRHRPLLLRRWLPAQGLIALGTLPWLLLQYRLLAGQAVDQTQDFTLAHLGEILRQGAVAFTVGATFPAAYAWLAAVFVFVILGALTALLWRPATRRAGLLLGLWLLSPPLLVWVFDIWLQHFGERFISMSLPPLVLLLGWGAARLPPRRWGTAVMAVAYLLAVSLAINAWYFDPAVLKSDYGRRLADIARDALPGDVLLLNGPQQATLFEIYQPAGVAHAFISSGSLLSEADAERDLPALVEGYDRAWLVLHGDPATYDPDHQAEAWLSRHGYKALTRDYIGAYVTLYILADGTDAAGLLAAEAQFVGGPRLIGYNFEPATLRPGDTLLVTARWLAVEPMPANYTIFTHLWDAAGVPVAQLDSQPQSGTRPTSQWQPGDIVLDHYALLIPTDLAPGDYTLNIGMYDLATLTRLTLTGGDEPALDHLQLGTVQIAP